MKKLNKKIKVDKNKFKIFSSPRMESMKTEI